jgi:hypothetical protein
MAIWHKCDIDQSNMINFHEFLFMLYMWQYAIDAAPVEAPPGSHGGSPLRPLGASDNSRTERSSRVLKQSSWRQRARKTGERAPSTADKVALYSAFFSEESERQVVFDAFRLYEKGKLAAMCIL